MKFEEKYPDKQRVYEVFFKTIFDPDVVPERLEELLSLLLKQTVKTLQM